MKNFTTRIAGLFFTLSLPICHAGNITWPDTNFNNNNNTNPSKFGISLTGLALQPNASNLDYAVHTSPLPLTIPSWTQQYVTPGFSGAVDVGFLYQLEGGDNALHLNWLYLDTKDSASDTATGSESVAPPYYFGPGAQALRGSSASSDVIFQLHDVNLYFSHLFTLGQRFLVSPFVGVDYAHIRQNITSSYAGTDANIAAYSITAYYHSKFDGAGPQFGSSIIGVVTSRFNVVAQLAVSLLAGTVNSTTSFLSAGAGNVNPVESSLANENQTRMIPEVNSKLGIEYTIPLRLENSIIFEAGYIFTVYINAINQVTPATLVPNAFNQGVIAIATDTQVQSNLSINGPYLKLSWIFVS